MAGEDQARPEEQLRDFLTGTAVSHRRIVPNRMTPPQNLEERVAPVMTSHFPYARCFPCVARDLDVTEVEVQSAAHILVVADRFRLVRRICYGCSRAGDTLVPEADPEA